MGTSRVANALTAAVYGGAALALMGAIAPLQAQKTDVVVMTNGNRITGEVKGLSHGTLDYSTDDMGRLSIEWNKVVRLSSRQTFEVTLKSGQKLFGSLVEGAQDGTLALSGAAVNTVPVGEVVGIAPVDQKFWRRLSGSVDLGLTYAKVNGNVQLTSAGGIRYRESRFDASLQFSTYLQDQSGSDQVTEHNLSIGAQRDVGRRWSAGVLGQWQQNDELNLALRSTFGAVAMRTLVENNREEIRIPVGLVVNLEKFYSSDSSLTSLEALLGIDVAAYRFDSPKLDLSGSARAFPSLTEAGRVRAQVELRVKYELFHDFFLGARLSDSYDSDPPESGAAKNDVTTALTIGWSFNE
jgi:hypothetical protein